MTGTPADFPSSLDHRLETVPESRVEGHAPPLGLGRDEAFLAQLRLEPVQVLLQVSRVCPRPRRAGRGEEPV